MFPRIPDDKTNFTGLWEEYKLLQDKVDKIGAFRFQVKGWLIPLVSAWLVAVYTAKITPWANLFAAVVPVLFYLLERNHHKHQAAFLRRIYAIEDALIKSKNSPYFGPSPRVPRRVPSKGNSETTPSDTPKSNNEQPGANQESKKTQQSQQSKKQAFAPTSPGGAISGTNDLLSKGLWGCLTLKAHDVFYAVIFVALIAVAGWTIRQSPERKMSSPNVSQCPCQCLGTTPALPGTPAPSLCSVPVAPVAAIPSLQQPVQPQPSPQQPSPIVTVPHASLPTTDSAPPNSPKVRATANPAPSNSPDKRPIARKKGQ
jgi:hypothetical protein